MRITDHVYVLSGSHYSACGQGDYLGEVYGVDAPGGLIMIDSGCSAAAFAQIRETLSYWRLPDKPACIITTHSHWDHCGNTRAFQELGAKVAVGAEDAYQCVNGGSRGLDLASPFEDSHIYAAFTPDVLIDAECAKDICGLQVQFYKIPGHTPGSIAPLFEIDGKRILFTGDALQPAGEHIGSVSFGWSGDVRFSRAKIVESMMHLYKEAHGVDIILPGHGSICMKNGDAVIRLAAQRAMETMR